MSDEYELLPVSTLNELKKEVEELKKIKKEAASADDLFESLKELADYVDKLVVIDADLHSRITDLMIKVTDLTKEMKEISELLKRGNQPQLHQPVKRETVTKPSNPMPQRPIVPQNIHSDDPVEEIRRLREENEKLLNQLTDLEKVYREKKTKEMLKKVLEKHYGGI